MSTVAATFRRIERALWVAALLSLVGLLGLGVPTLLSRDGGMPWEWLTRIAVALLGIAALVARASVQRGRRRVEELDARMEELEVQATASASGSIPATRAEPATPAGGFATIRGLAADIERRARVAEGEARRDAASIDAALARLRDIRATHESDPIDEASGAAFRSRVSESVEALSQRIAVMGSQQALQSQRSVELVGQVEALAGSHASLASGLALLEGISDRADALALRCSRMPAEASAPAAEIASDLAAFAQEMAAAIAGTHAALSTGRDASSRALIAARDHASERERTLQAERELATAARALATHADEAASAVEWAAAQGRGLAVDQASALARAVEELGGRAALAGDARRPSDELEELAREAGRLQALVARLVEPGPP